MPIALNTHSKIAPSFDHTIIDTHDSTMNNAINKATVISFEKRNDQKTWYIIKVEPQLYPVLFKKRSMNESYLIAKRYEDFVLFSHKLHERFNSKCARAGTRRQSESTLPIRIKNRLSILPTSKFIHAQRAEELNLFLNSLFSQSSLMISESCLVLEFFELDIPTRPKNRSSSIDNLSSHESNIPSSRWKRLRCTSFLARSPPSTNGLSFLCSQAANKIIPSWNRYNTSTHTSLQPSTSTPASIKSTHMHRTSLMKSQSSLSVQTELTHPPLETGHIDNYDCSPQDDNQLKSLTIKIKIIYDINNIIVIQVPRSITLNELKSRIKQKLSDAFKGPVSLDTKEIFLLYHDINNSSISSSITDDGLLLPASVISKEDDLVQMMYTKWNKKDKVTLRCIV
ncbi:hypothetical protein BDB01DRAFT_877559 [Pilobolus umbonatus]|nr:hypothetical protein BDB01DRAFT_877559 [Pilobolus umbonatus]